MLSWRRARGPCATPPTRAARRSSSAWRSGCAARAARRRCLLLRLRLTGNAQVSSIRHLAYASDVGEAFRPTVPRWVVNGTYAIAVGCVAKRMRAKSARAPDAAPQRSYVAADVAHQTAKAHRAGAPPEEARAPRRRTKRRAHPAVAKRLFCCSQVQRVAAQTATFQLLASILAPFAVIHTSVGLAKKALASAPAALARHGPTAIGLACIPLLPLVDHPIEHGARPQRFARACSV